MEGELFFVKMAEVSPSLWYIPQRDDVSPCVPSSSYFPPYWAALRSVTEEEMPGIGEYRAWLQQAPSYGIPSTSQYEIYMAWRNRCPPAPPERCTRCKSTRLMFVSTEHHDQVLICLDDGEHQGVPSHDLNIGGGDFIEFEVCADCGQMKGQWPLPEGIMEQIDD